MWRLHHPGANTPKARSPSLQLHSRWHAPPLGNPCDATTGKAFAMSFLKLTDVTKFYGSTCAVQAMNLSVEKGEFVSLLGPSGCGKTTTLQMVAGFEAVSSGRIALDGRDITHAKANTRGLGIVFQTYALFPHMTVADNVSFCLLYTSRCV